MCEEKKKCEIGTPISAVELLVLVYDSFFSFHICVYAHQKRNSALWPGHRLLCYSFIISSVNICILIPNQRIPAKFVVEFIFVVAKQKEQKSSSMLAE